MLSLTRKTDYALVALAYLADRWLKQQGPASARVIADAYALPLSLLMNILKELSGTGLLTSTRGASGGYMLAMPPGEISLADVVTTLEGPVRFAACSDEMVASGRGCPVGSTCPIRDPILYLHEQINGFLRNMSLEDLLRGSNGQPLANGPGQCAGTTPTKAIRSMVTQSNVVAAD